MSSNNRIKPGVTCIITGASSGIGRSLAVMLAQRYKARLVLNARKEALLMETARLVSEAGGQAVTVVGDISDEAIAKQIIQACVNEFGSVDWLVNNAGLAKPGALTNLTPQDWHFVFNVNFFGPLYAIYAALPQFVKQGHGKIINVASVAGKVAFPGSVCYAASKFALTGMSEGMAAELAPKNIDVITVCPGLVRTEFFTNNLSPDERNPSLIAQSKNFRGWLMRNWLSISTESCAEEIIKACQRGGSQEIIMTIPGVVIDRMQGMFPQLLFSIAKRIPTDRF